MITVPNVHLKTMTLWGEGRGAAKIRPTTFGQQILQTEPTITFKVEYPLTRPKVVTLEHDAGCGWTLYQLVLALHAAYRAIYAEERNPGHIPGPYNRGRSEGPYGIWGHDFGDLILEAVERGEDGVWSFWVGS